MDFPALCTANTDRLQAKRFLLNDLSSAMSGRPVEVVIEPDLHFKRFGRAQERIDHSVPRFAHIRNLTPAARVDEELFYFHLMQAVQEMLDLLCVGLPVTAIIGMIGFLMSAHLSANFSPRGCIQPANAFQFRNRD